MSEEKHTTGPAPSSKPSLETAAMQDTRMQDVHAQLMREKDEPEEGFSPVPIFLIFLFAALCFWGGVYLVENSGGYRWDAYSPDFDPAADAPAPVEIPLFQRGARIYRNQCAQCHQADGTGIAGVYPPLDGSDWVTGHQEVLARILINGFSGPMEVKGNTYNGNMPAFGPSGLNLNARDIAAVLTYIRQEWSNSASDMTVATMENYMSQYASRSAPWTDGDIREDLSAEPEPEAEPEPDEESVAEEPAAEES